MFRNKMKAMAVAMVASFASVSAFAQTSSDPTSTITTQLGTYATDVGLIAAAVLLIVYGKKLVGYLRV